MTLIDSLDSIIMLYSYAGFPERTFAIFERPSTGRGSSARPSDASQAALEPNVASSARIDPEALAPAELVPELTGKHKDNAKGGATVAVAEEEDVHGTPETRSNLRVKQNAMSNLSIILTTMSIVVAFR